MSREQSLQSILQASAKLQWNVAIILEAKAVEAEKVQSWVCGHMRHDTDGAHPDHLKACGDVHEQVIETIEGVTKLGQGLTETLKALLHSGEEAGGGMGGMFGGGFGLEDT